MSTLVFLPGAGCTSAIFDAQLEAFPGSVALAYAGTIEAIDGYADAVAAELASRDIEDAILVGFSMGGAVALTLALRHAPQVRALALLGSGSRLRVAPAILDGLASDFDTTARMIAGFLLANPTSERVEFCVGMMYAVGEAQTRAGFAACNTFDVTDRLGAIALPVVAITGERDAMTPPKYGQSLADRIPGAAARILAGAGHLVMVENPADTNEALRAFVAQVR